MGITVIIVGGVVIVTVITTLFDYLGKRSKGASPELERRIETLEKRLGLVDLAIAEKDEKIKQLEEEVSFVNRLLEKKN